MRKAVALLAAGTTAVLIAVAPTAAAFASVDHAASTGKYTLTVTGDGSRASIGYVAAAKTGTPKTEQVSSAKLPWHKKLSAKTDLVEVTAAQTHGTKISCSITDGSGHVLSTSSGYGKHGVAVCVVTSDDLFGSKS